MADPFADIPAASSGGTSDPFADIGAAVKEPKRKVRDKNPFYPEFYEFVESVPYWQDLHELMHQT
jgi:hypothetical protein